MSRETIASAPGRICLAGEDIDWISGPSVLCAIDLKTQASVKNSDNHYLLETEGSLNSKLLLLKEEIGTYTHHTLDYTNAAIKVIKDLGIEAVPISVEITSNLPAKAGLSSSAAVSVASVAAIASFYGSSLDANDVCDLAYKIESEELKTGAGQMDMYSSGLGGLIYLDSSTVPPKDIERFVLPNGFDIVIADTLTPRNTSDVIRDKRKRYEAREPQIMKYVGVTQDAINEIRDVLKGTPINTERLGNLIYKCHTSLRDDMGVSTNLMEEGIIISLKNGAIGAKLTGTGMGGCFFALVPINETKRLVNSLKDLPVKVYVTKPSEKGVAIHKT